MQARVYENASDVATRLGEFGLTEELLRLSVEAGLSARNTCTKNDPPVLAGVLMWGRTMRAVRENLAPAGWVGNDDGNYSVTLSADGRMAIGVATGDEGTGVIAHMPRTKYPKGPATHAAVARNVQLDLFLPVPDRKPADVVGPVTWLLLIACAGDEVRAELSCPAGIGDDGRVEAWRERIVLTPVKLGSPVPPDFEPGPEIDVDVIRRVQ